MKEFRTIPYRTDEGENQKVFFIYTTLINFLYCKKGREELHANSSFLL